MPCTAIVIAALLALGPAQDPSSDLPRLKASAEAGDAAAQLAYARALKDSDETAARQWAQKAADQGLGEAWYWLGGRTLVDADKIAMFKRAVDLGYDQAFERLMEYLLFRASNAADVNAAKKYGDLARQRGASLGDDTSKMLTTIDRCYEAGEPAIPMAHRPTVAERETYETEIACTPPYLVGKRSAADSRGYRLCLLSQTTDQNRWLAEVYANGWGVRRDPRLAMALVCHGSDVPAELELLVDDLYQSRDDETLDKPFLFCDHVTSGQNSGVCAVRDAGPAEDTRDRAWTALTAKWPTAQRTALATAREAAGRFFDLRAGYEVATAGTARIAIGLEAEAAMHDELLAAVKEFETGKLPARAPLAAADAELNRVYAQLMGREHVEFDEAKSENIRETQRAWLVYRDAWAAFAARRYPSRLVNDWKAWATAIRVKQLAEIIDR